MSANIEAITSVTEEDMSVFGKIQNALVEGSKLAKEDFVQVKQDLATLRAQVQTLQMQVEGMKDANRRLDDMYANVSRQRDDAMAEASNVKHELEKIKRESERAHDEFVVVKQELEIARERIDGLIKERDDAQFKALEWEEKANSFREILDGIEARIGSYTTSLGIRKPSQVVKPIDEEVAAPEVAAPVPTLIPGYGEHTTPDAGGDSGTEKKPHWEEQERDPATLQFRSYPKVAE